MGMTPHQILPGTQGEAESQRLQQQKEMLMKMMQPRTQLAAPQAPAQPQGGKSWQGPIPPGYEKQAFFQNLGATIQGAVAQQKEKQIRAALADYSAIGTAWDRAQEMSQGDPQKSSQMFQNDPVVQAVMGDTKKMKNIAKAFSMDWLNPEKQTVYQEALKRHLQADKAGKMSKVLRTLLGQHQKGQVAMTGQERQGMIQEQTQKLPMQTKGTDPKAAAEMMRLEVDVNKSKAEVDRATAALREKYDIRPDKDGNLVAINKADPGDVVRITDSKGREVTAAPKVGAKPEVLQPKGGGPPYGISRDGKAILPGSPEWTAADQAMYAGAKESYATGEASKTHRVELAARVRAQAYGQIREYGVINKQTGEMEMLNPEVINANRGLYAPVSGAMQTMNRSAIFKEIDYTGGQVGQAITEMGDEGFSPGARAQMAYVLRSSDPRSALQSFLESDVAATMTDPQIKYVTSLVSLQESAMSLRSLAGMGQGSDQLRSAITKMLPGPGTPSKKYAERQMQLFQGEVNALRKSVPGLGDIVKRTGPDKDLDVIYARDPSGKLHEAKKGTALPTGWKLENAAK